MTVAVEDTVRMSVGEQIHRASIGRFEHLGRELFRLVIVHTHVQAGDAAYITRDRADVVRDNHHGHLVGELLEQLPKAAADALVEACGRLVHQQQLGACGERSGDQRALQLAAGQRADLAVSQFSQIDALEHRRCLFVIFSAESSAGAAHVKPAHEHQFADGDRKTEVEVETLRNVTDTSPRALRGSAEDLHRAAVGFNQTEHDLEQRGFAAAVGAEDGHVIVALE